MHRALWVAQGLVAVVFVFAGGSKLLTPPETLAMLSPFPVSFILVIGVCEVLGALGLILPLALKVRPEVTVLAAVGLTVIMVGATLSTLAMGLGVLALVPAGLGVMTALVAYGRRSLLTLPRRDTLAAQPA
ncbi:MAG: DoxX family protein [Thermomicrobiales bacterium]